tara:strand:+ start:103 stop:732 length:630 start_codon:yes stop_codon:yes gene_type:complete
MKNIKVKIINNCLLLAVFTIPSLLFANPRLQETIGNYEVRVKGDLQFQYEISNQGPEYDGFHLKNGGEFEINPRTTESIASIVRTVGVTIIPYKGITSSSALRFTLNGVKFEIIQNPIFEYSYIINYFNEIDQSWAVIPVGIAARPDFTRFARQEISVVRDSESRLATIIMHGRVVVDRVSTEFKDGDDLISISLPEGTEFKILNIALN